MAKGLVKDIRDYHIRVCSFSKSPIEKSYDGYTVYPVIVSGGIPDETPAAIRVILYTFLTMKADVSADCAVLCVAWQRTG
jgi:hypothetical protein